MPIDDRGLFDGGMRRENRLQLAQLNAMSANFYLAIDAAQEFNVSVGQPAGQVARAIIDSPQTNGLGTNLLAVRAGSLM